MSSSFAEELIRLLPRLKSFALGLTGSPQDADDLVQAGCECALRAWRQWTPGTRLDSWVFRIMRNHWIDGIRKRKSEGNPGPLHEMAEVAGTDGRRATESAMLLDAVGNAIADLPEDQRRVLLLVCAEGRSYRDAADALGIPIGTVMSRLARARGRIAALLGLDDSDERTAAEARSAVP
jgi:RNA polymerase sigma-70 factor (ECF subfamily)